MLPPFQHAVPRVGHGPGGGQPVALAEVDGAAGRHEVPEIVVAPARPRKTVVDVRSGSNTRRGPDAGERESFIAQLLRPFEGNAGVVAAFGPVERVVRFRSGPAFPDQGGRLAGVGRPPRCAAQVRRAIPVQRQLPPFPYDDRIQPAGELTECLPEQCGNPEPAELRQVFARQHDGPGGRPRSGKSGFEQLPVAGSGIRDVVNRHPLDILTGVVYGAGNDGGPVRIKPGAEPKVGRRDVPQPVERVLCPAISTRSRRALRQSMMKDQGQVLLQPVQADGAEGDFHVVVRAMDDQPRRRFCESHQGPKQPQLVGRRLVVVHDHVAQQRQAAGAVVRYGEDQRFPVYAGTRQVRLRRAAAQRDGPAVCEADQFLRRSVMESPGGVFRGVPAATQRDYQQSGRIEQLGKQAERPFPDPRRHVHPHAAQQNQVEPPAECAQDPQVRQRVVHPDHAWMGAIRGEVPQRARFHRHDFPSPGRKPVGVASGTGADVAGESRFFTQVRRRPVCVDVVRVDSVIPGDEGVGVEVVVAGAVHGDMARCRG